jgi:NADPH:quinone reductase-like Zn-dependent oxidoreductase
MAHSNRAAFLVAKNAPLEVRESTYTPPREHEMVVKNHALAINMYDWMIQEAPKIVVSWIKLPFIFGTDAAGEIVAVGEGIKRFKVGDRVVVTALGLGQHVNRACEGGFQEYTVVRPEVTTSIPEDMSYETACVMPLGLATVACALFLKDSLALPLPSTSPAPAGRTLLIWGGSSSVGCNAIQLAKAAGYKVITTASPGNHEYLKKLGANEVFDYHSPTVIPDIIAAFRDRPAGGAVSIGRGSWQKCAEILRHCNGNRFIAMVTIDLPDFPKSVLGLLPFIVSVIASMIFMQARLAMKGVKVKIVNASEMLENGIARPIFEDFLPEALEQKKFVPAPEPQIVGNGLEYIQEAMNMSKKGVSAKKLVVTL